MDSRTNKKSVKKGLSTEDGRKRREAVAVAIRKEKKDEGLTKRRNLTLDNFENEANNEQTDSSSIGQVKTEKVYSVVDIPELIMDMNSSDGNKQYFALKGFRKLLSVESNPPVRQCIECGALNAFVLFLQRSDAPRLQFEAAWAITNIASTEHTNVVVQVGAVPILVKLLTSESPDVREQSAWCLGNIAGDSATFRDTVLGHGALMPLIANIGQPANLSLLRNCIWTLSNFCRGKPQPPLPLIMSAIPTLANILSHNTDQASLVDATWALSYISDGDDNRIQAVVSAGVVPALIEMLKCNKAQIIIPALRTIGNIVTGSDESTQLALQYGLLSAVPRLLECSKKNIRKETCWMLSNIAAGTTQQLQQLVDEEGVVPRVLEQLAFGKEWDVRKEACWVVCNIICDGDKRQHMQKLVEHGVVKHLCDILVANEIHIVKNTLCAIETLLKFDPASIRDLIDEADGIEKIEDLQNHSNAEIYKKASEIIETHFGGEEIEESAEIAPVSNGNVFSFGINNSVPQKGFNFANTPDFNQKPQIQNQQFQFTFGNNQLSL